MVLGFVPSVRESHFNGAPLLAAEPIGCIGTHGCSDKQGCVGESAAGFSFLGSFYFGLGRFRARGRPLSYGGE